MAEQNDGGEFGYQYCGRGGESCALPYCAGVLALGWQVAPEVPPDRMRELLLESAHRKDDGWLIINLSSSSRRTR